MKSIELTRQITKSERAFAREYGVSSDLVQRINYKIAILVRDTSDQVELEENFA